MMNRIMIVALVFAGCGKKSDAEAVAKTEPTTAPKPAAAAAPANGIQVADIKNPEGKAFAQYAGNYDKAIAFRSKSAERMYVYVARDCPELSCSADRYNMKATCAWGLVLDFTTIKNDAKPGKHPAHVAVKNWGADDSEFVGDPIQIDLQELTDASVAGTIQHKSDRGNVNGSFKATLCKDE